MLSAVDVNPVSCRALLADLHAALPHGLYGNRKGCFPAQLWTHVLWQLETARDEQQPCAGVMADIVKAFNNLPRPVIKATVELLGVPDPIVRAWHGAVSTAQRYFQIRSSFSGPTPSSTGYAEGDGLSIIAMLAVNYLFHAWFERSQVPVQSLSFVDDWQLIVQHHVHIQHAMDQIQRFCDCIDLHMDKRKKFVWSLTTEGRKQLRDHGHKVHTQCRTLDAHLALSA